MTSRCQGEGETFRKTTNLLRRLAKKKLGIVTTGESPGVKILKTEAFDFWKVCVELYTKKFTSKLQMLSI